MSLRLSGAPAEIEVIADELRSLLAEKFGDCFASHQRRVYRDNDGTQVWFFAELACPVSELATREVSA
ncbi:MULTISPECIES: hypothetical protein [unclassified Nocardia]|uniref:hypothetical protein n=1 Tax=unclassified Nocardia TaxID=2637762 RepID=UPI001CE4296B|nr:MULTISPECIES: hypothetical protein [unclassified Nocardia]